MRIKVQGGSNGGWRKVSERGGQWECPNGHGTQAAHRSNCPDCLAERPKHGRAPVAGVRR